MVCGLLFVGCCLFLVIRVGVLLHVCVVCGVCGEETEEVDEEREDAEADARMRFVTTFLAVRCTCCVCCCTCTCFLRNLRPSCSTDATLENPFDSLSCGNPVIDFRRTSQFIAQ